jgi:hypothetical protein
MSHLVGAELFRREDVRERNATEGAQVCKETKPRS